MIQHRTSFTDNNNKQEVLNLGVSGPLQTPEHRAGAAFLPSPRHRLHRHGVRGGGDLVRPLQTQRHTVSGDSNQYVHRGNSYEIPGLLCGSKFSTTRFEASHGKRLGVVDFHLAQKK